MKHSKHKPTHLPESQADGYVDHEYHTDHTDHEDFEDYPETYEPEKCPNCGGYHLGKCHKITISLEVCTKCGFLYEEHSKEALSSKNPKIPDNWKWQENACPIGPNPFHETQVFKSHKNTE